MSAYRRLALALVALALVALAVPSLAAASVPNAWTDGDARTSPNAVTLQGEAAPNGEPTTFYFEYAPASSEFCTSNGSSGTPQTTTDAPVHYYGETLETDVTALTPGEDFCFRILARNPSGTAPGALKTFTVGAPYVTTARQRNTSASASTLRGWVQPAGQAGDYHFEYGQPPDHCTDHTTPQGTVPATAGGVDVEAEVTGLTPGSVYCFRLIASNPSATRTGSLYTFTAGLPQLEPPQATATGPTTETLSQMVNPAGQDTTYHVEYDPFSSYFCYFWEHQVPTATHTTPAGSIAGAAGDTRVSVALDGLSPGTEYCSRLFVTNATGASEDNAYNRWTAGAPELRLVGASPLSATTARVRASVNPAGSATNVIFKYAAAGSSPCSRHDWPGSSATAAETVPGDNASHEIITRIEGLAPATTYCVWAVATNGHQALESGETTFTTMPADASPPPPERPLLRSFALPSRVVSPRFTGVGATVELGQPGATVTMSAFRVVNGSTGARVGRVHRELGSAGRHRLTVLLTKSARRGLAKLSSVRLRVRLIAQGVDGRQAKRTADVRLVRRG